MAKRRIKSAKPGVELGGLRVGGRDMALGEVHEMNDAERTFVERYFVTEDAASETAPDIFDPVRVKRGTSDLYGEGGTPLPLGGGGVLATGKRTTPYVLDSPIITPIDFDSPLTFTAPSSGRVRIDVAAIYRFYQQGSSTVSLVMYVGPNSISGRLGQVHQEDALQPGVQRFALAASSSRKATLSAFKLVESLTAGTTYRIEICPTITGGGQFMTVAGDPYYLAISDAITPHPEAAEVVATKSVTTGRISVFASRGFNDTALVDLKGSVVTPAIGQAGKLAVTPDGSKVVVCQQAANNVVVVNTGAPVKTAAGIVGGGSWVVTQEAPVAPPGSNPFPIEVAIEPGGTHAWVLCPGTGTVVRMNLADRTFGVPIALGAATGATGIAISPDGTTLLIACTAAANKLVKVVIAGSVVTSVALNAAAGVVFHPNGTEAFVITRGAGVGDLLKVRVSDLAILDTEPLGVAPQAIDIFPDGRSLLVFSDSAVSEQVRHHLTSDLSKYIGWRGAHDAAFDAAELYDGAIGPFGGIFTSSADLDQISHWPGGQFNFTPNSSFHNERFEALVTAA